MSLHKFMESFYFPLVEATRRRSTLAGYLQMWRVYFRGRRQLDLSLREFRTFDARTLLDAIAAQHPLSRNSLRHLKALLSDAFAQALNDGILDETNPLREVRLPRLPASEATYAYDLGEVKRMAAILPEPARTVILVAAFSGLRKGEIRGLRWTDYNPVVKTLSVQRSVWRRTIGDPKTEGSKAQIPVLGPLADALNAHRVRTGRLAVGYVFEAGNGSPLNLDNLARRVIIPILEDTGVSWHGWHAFRRGLATTLHRLGVADRTIQAVLRHSDVKLTMNIYTKVMQDTQVAALDVLSTEYGTGQVATTLQRTVN